MAKAAKAETADDSAERLTVEPSDLDELTHAEMLELYRSSSDTIRFAKHQQWGTLLGSFGLFVLLGLTGDYAAKTGFLFKLCIIISLVLSVGAIYSLVIYQFWQNAEREKMNLIAERFSNLTRMIRGLVTERERNFHRYVLLFFMMASIVLANWLLIVFLAPRT
jgi:CDP-diglyceride synthetase